MWNKMNTHSSLLLLVGLVLCSGGGDHVERNMSHPFHDCTHPLSNTVSIENTLHASTCVVLDLSDKEIRDSQTRSHELDY
ncbi:hypothetical protein IQ07DRAFT_274792 [Pyrenochaeta sp. DS3sAY3a]|nr:hypothetical protein IQ07DRAFT_274792 [Pyrenochaeta sp. DS3sAY3a]